MLVTVYITNYNYAKFINKAVNSVFEQTFKEWELIIIDDGSTDGSKEIIQSFDNQDNVRVLFQQNKGLNATNNVALSMAKGKYIMRLDADDFLHPTALETLVKKLESDEELGLVFPNYYLVDEDGIVISEEVRHDFDNEVVLYDQAAHGACTMIRADFLREVGGYNEAYKCQDGYELWVKFTQKFKVSNVNHPLFYYRQHGSNLTSNENRILDTRAQINKDFVRSENKDASSIIIIPVRGGKQDVAFKKLGEKTFLELKIDQALASENRKMIVVSSPDKAVENIIAAHYEEYPEVIFHERSSEKARLGEDLNTTISTILELPQIVAQRFKHICILTVEFPFLKPHKIDDAIHTLILFGADSLLSVRASNSVFYVHRGDGLHSVMNRDKFTKIEREAIFVHAGGIYAITKDEFSTSGKMVSGLVGHMMIDKESSFGVFSQYDLDLAKNIVSLHE